MDEWNLLEIFPGDDNTTVICHYPRKVLGFLWNVPAQRNVDFEDQARLFDYIYAFFRSDWSKMKSLEQDAT